MFKRALCRKPFGCTRRSATLKRPKRKLSSSYLTLRRCFPRPNPRVLQRILQIATNPGDLVLDSFAGSGTTGHAVLQMNAQDGGNRRFILVEMVPDIARKIAAERLRRVIQGYTRTDSRGKEHAIAGLGGGFRYCTLDEPLFDARGRVRWGVTFGELARHIFFTETGHPLAGRAGRRNVVDR